MKERISNILAWFGFGYPALLLFGGILAEFTPMDEILQILADTHNYRVEEALMSLVVYGVCVTINYLIIGRLWLIPWR
jgi:hypothetical protein